MTRYGRTRSRPLGVTVLCALVLLGSVGSLLGAVGAFALWPFTGTKTFVAGVLGLGLGLGQLVSVVGLWYLRPWGWYLAVVFHGGGLVLGVLNGNAVGILVGLVVVAYLFAVRERFR